MRFTIIMEPSLSRTNIPVYLNHRRVLVTKRGHSDLSSHKGCATEPKPKKQKPDDGKRKKLVTFPDLPEPSMAASTQVFGIPELLEMALFHATELSLLTLQQFNKTWRDVIEGSSRLQQKLRIKADPVDVNGELEDFNKKSFD
ncbi:hypothetical protein ABVK25_011119 [Lepraria finkii]|uniref:Uncharacterized protein n=1 Tax=Lepraria finkii TaxID=1340010 RepID=A0ABR4AX13_9LECA